MGSLISFFLLLGTYLAMEADPDSPHINADPYPVTDGDGYSMAYQDGDTWDELYKNRSSRKTDSQ